MYNEQCTMNNVQCTCRCSVKTLNTSLSPPRMLATLVSSSDFTAALNIFELLLAFWYSAIESKENVSANISLLSSKWSVWMKNSASLQLVRLHYQAPVSPRLNIFDLLLVFCYDAYICFSFFYFNKIPRKEDKLELSGNFFFQIQCSLWRYVRDDLRYWGGTAIWRTFCFNKIPGKLSVNNATTILWYKCFPPSIRTSLKKYKFPPWKGGSS